MDPFSSISIGICETSIVVWAETRDPEIVRVAAITRRSAGSGKSPLNLFWLTIPRASLHVLGVDRDVEGELLGRKQLESEETAAPSATNRKSERIAERTGRPAYEVFPRTASLSCDRSVPRRMHLSAHERPIVSSDRTKATGLFGEHKREDRNTEPYPTPRFVRDHIRPSRLTAGGPRRSAEAHAGPP